MFREDDMEASISVTCRREVIEDCDSELAEDGPMTSIERGSGQPLRGDLEGPRTSIERGPGHPLRGALEGPGTSIERGPGHPLRGAEDIH